MDFASEGPKHFGEMIDLHVSILVLMDFASEGLFRRKLLFCNEIPVDLVVLFGVCFGLPSLFLR
jgi:hypothetical protein